MYNRTDINSELFAPQVSIEALLEQRRQRGADMQQMLMDQAAQSAADPQRARMGSMFGSIIGNALGNNSGAADTEMESLKAKNAQQKVAQGQYVDGMNKPTSAGMRQQALMLKDTYPAASVKLIALANDKQKAEEDDLKQQERDKAAAEVATKAEQRRQAAADAEAEKVAYNRKIAETEILRRQSQEIYDRSITAAKTAKAADKVVADAAKEDARVAAEAAQEAVRIARADAEMAGALAEQKRREQVQRDVVQEKRTNELRQEGVSKADAQELAAQEAESNQVTIMSGKQYNVQYPDANLPEDSMWKAKANGDISQILKPSRSNTTVNIPAGQTANFDDKGNITELINITGGPQDIAARKVTAQAEQAQVFADNVGEGKTVKNNVIGNAIQTAKDLSATDSILNPIFGKYGLAELAGGIEGTARSDMQAVVSTLEANSGFSTLQAMREQSKNGGALGSISEAEMVLLTAALGSLKLSQSKEQFDRNLAAFEVVYYDTVNGVGSWAASQAPQAPQAQAPQTQAQAPQTPAAAPQAAPAAPQALGNTTRPDGAFTQDGKAYVIRNGVVYAN